MEKQRRSTRRTTAFAAALGAALSVALLAGCGANREATGASQTAAKVNKDEVTVHQINHVLQQQRSLRPEQAEVAGKQILERLIDQQLALQRADDMKLDRDPRVVQQLEAARRDIIARAYMEKVSEAAVKPTPEEVQKYYEDKPALFSERRIYNIHEVAIEATGDKVPELRTQLGQAKNFSDFLEHLKNSGYRYSANQAVRAAEQLPLQSLDTFARMKDGQALLTQTPAGATVIVLANSRSQPISVEQARPAIEQFLLNERKRKLMEEDVKSMRAAAKIEYVGKFGVAPNGTGTSTAGKGIEAAADTAAAAASAAPATPALPPACDVAVQPPAAAPPGGLTASDINKGMGLGK
jgi:EpsD family peptidyl-prolyl cis-trans isomerase